MVRLIKKPDENLGHNLRLDLWERAMRMGVSITETVCCEDGWLSDGLMPFTLTQAFWRRQIPNLHFFLKSQTHEYSHEHPQE